VIAAGLVAASRAAAAQIKAARNAGRHGKRAADLALGARPATKARRVAALIVP
jgi:hypothetical protein